MAASPTTAPLAITLLLGSGVVAPSLLALVFANHSNRGDLLIRTKGLAARPLPRFCRLLIPRLGPLGAAIADRRERHPRSSSACSP